LYDNPCRKGLVRSLRDWRFSPADVEKEMIELVALERLKTITPSRAVLEKIAIKYY
jgi:hypothetical protein